MKYLVMECRPAYAVVLGDDGAFRKVANLRYEVGQTVTNVIPLNLPEVTQPPKTNSRRWISAVSALAACLVLVLSVFLTGQIPYASVYLTINPEVRIDVSRSDTVVGVEGMNADGAELLEGYDHKKKDLDTVMDELVDRAIDMGYLHEGGKITLSLDGDAEWIVSHETHLNQHLNDHLTDKITVTIDIEQKQPEQPTPTAPPGTIVIPVGPGNYGDSDYDDGECDYEPTDAADSDYDMDDGQSDYNDPDSDYTSSDSENSGYGQSDYEAPEDDGQTDYDDWSEEGGESEYGEQSDYGDTEDQRQSDYVDEEDDAASDYDEPDDSGQTDYNDEDDFSDYEEADSEYEDSDYDEE